MIDIAKSDLFFVITSMAVIILTVIIAVLLVYIFLMLRNVKNVIDKVKVESDGMIEDIKELRLKIKADGSIVRKASAFVTFFRSAFMGKRKR